MNKCERVVKKRVVWHGIRYHTVEECGRYAPYATPEGVVLCGACWYMEQGE